jgi:two-component system, OmpR family, phosphate regulon sensor histidine kinase PhoR
MDFQGNQLIVFLIVLEIVQLLLFWAFVRRRYQLSLRQLGRLTGQLADGNRPGSYYVDGPPAVMRMARDLESVGLRLEDLQRRQQEEDFNLNVLLANMVEGVMVVDQRHVVRLANDELLSLFHLKTSPLNRTVLESLREARVEMIVRETVQRGEPQRQDVVLENTGGSPTRHFEVSAVPIRTKKGEIGGAVVVFHDITRIKHLEVVRSEFVANVSHELRTPLAIFRGYLETLLEHPELPAEETKRMLQAMRRHSERLNALVEDLLILTRFEAKQVVIEFSVIRLDAFFRQLIQDWQQRMGSDAAAIELDVPGNLPALEVDPLRFEQVILNLLENAVAYSNPPRRIAISASHDDGRIEVRVADNGIGIPPADLPHVFERFYRVDKGRSRVSGGTGLGLSIVKQMVQSHGGTIHVESESGKGTTVVLRLPVTQEPGGAQPLLGLTTP